MNGYTSSWTNWSQCSVKLNGRIWMLKCFNVQRWLLIGAFAFMRWAHMNVSLFSLDFIWALNFQVEMRKLWKLFNAQFMIQQAVISGFVKAQISLKCMIKCLSNWLSADWSAKIISFGKNIKVLVHPKMKIFIIYSFSCSKINQQVENMTLISQLYIMQWVSKFRDPRPLQGSSNATASMVSGCYNKKECYSARWPSSLSKGISGGNPEMPWENEETDDCIAGIPTKYISGRQLRVSCTCSVESLSRTWFPFHIQQFYLHLWFWFYI